MPIPVLATKLFPPTRRPELVSRPRLADQLDTTLHAGHRLTLVSAPAGFGKSTLIGDWAARRAGADVRLAWLSLDEGDNAPPRFLAHLWATLSGVGLDLNPDALAGASTAAALTALLNEMAATGQQHPDLHQVLVLDDYHVIEGSDVHDAVAFVIDHAPDQFHLLVATRSDPPFALPKLRARGQLTEVRAVDLRFTPAEAREFLNENMGLNLTKVDVQALDDRTEGWIAGLQLAALSLRDITESEVAGFIEAFTGSHRFVIDYLVDEVLARQPSEVRDFLLRTAILERLTGSLCDAVTGGTDGSRVLEELDRGDVFLIALDAERSWYRYHHLFGDVLRARLLGERPELEPALHRAASTWYVAHGLVADAVHHALAAADHDRAAFLMETSLPELRRTRQDSQLLTWVRALPEPVVQRSPVLSITSAWSSMMAGDLDAMERRLDDAEAALAAGADDDASSAYWADTEDLATVPAMVWVYRAALAQARGDVPATVASARRALDLAGSDDHIVLGGANGYLGLAAWAAGDVQDALVIFAAAVRSLHAAGNLVDELDTTVVLGDMWLTAGRPHRARRLFEQALEAAARNGEPYPRATADLHVGLAELDRERNDLVGATAHLETAKALAERGSITENRHRWYTAMAQVHAASGRTDSAVSLLNEAEALYRPGFYPDLRPIAATCARVQIAAGHLDAAEQWARDHDVNPAQPPTFLGEYDHLTLVRLMLAQHRDAAPRRGRTPLDDVLALLDRIHGAADPTRPGSLLEIGMLRALTLHACRERAEALAELERTLTQAPEPEGYVRLFLDEGEPMLALLHDAAASNPRGEADVVRRHARRLLDAALSTELTGAPSSDVGLADPLSERELEVLRLLDTDLTGPQLAGQLFVSLNTLRSHTKRIFTKLDVSNRSAAVRRARELGLL